MKGFAFSCIMLLMLLHSSSIVRSKKYQHNKPTYLATNEVFPQSRNATSVRVTTKKCSCSCGQRSSKYFEYVKRIFGGKEAKQHSHPWLVRIISRDGTNLTHSFTICGGTILNTKYILTAAHCLEDINPKEIAVVLGDHDQISKDEAEHVDAWVHKIYMHSEFDPETFENDIALLKMKHPIKLKKHIQPACVPSYDKDPPAVAAWTVGWGQHNDGDQAPILREVKVPMMPHDKCSEILNYTGDITEDMLCAGGLGQDSCQGDSGGPLLICNKKYNKCAVHGVVSFGVDCGEIGHPGVYTKVYNYLDWMMNIMKISNCINCL